MREMLRHRRLVHEETARSQDARDLAKRGARAFDAPADVVAGAEIDDEIDARRLER